VLDVRVTFVASDYCVVSLYADSSLHVRHANSVG
jgi:hypothetical protein